MKNLVVLSLILLAWCTANAQVDLTDGLIAFYPFNGNAVDETGNNHNGITSGGVTLTSDRFGNPDQAYSFNGVDGKIELENSIGWNLNNGVGLTFSLWYKTDERMWFIHHHKCGYGNGFGCTLRDDFFRFHYSGLELHVPMPSDNNWHMATFTYDYVLMKVYVDGEFKEKLSQSGDYVTNDRMIVLGASSDPIGCPSYSKGILDDVRFYNRALNAQEIQALFTISPIFTQILTGDIATDIANERDGSWGDYDGDGYVDLYTSFQKLYHNNGNGTFTKITDSGINKNGPGTWADFDNDGLPDLFVRSVTEPNTIFRNLGNGKFEEVPGLFGDVNKYTWEGSWADYDRDGDLDVFIANHYIDGGFVNVLHSNNGDGTFTEAEVATFGIEGVNSEGSTWGDYNNDGNLDLFAANYSVDNFLYKNNGDGTFTKITGDPVVSDQWTTGGAWGDYNNDRYLDLFVINLVENSLYKNNGDGTFTKIMDGEIVNEYCSSRGCAWADFDNDGDLDLVVTNGWPQFNNTLVYSNNNDGTFTKETNNAIAMTGGVTGGALWADYDNDGDQDLMCTRGYTTETYNYLFENNGNSNSWISIKCMGTISNRDAIGTRVEAKATINGNPVWQMREIMNQTGTGQQNSVIVHFGFGDATLIDSLIIKWPSGIVSMLTNVAPKQHLILYETSNMPIFFQNPSDQTVCKGESITMIATANSSATITYQWQKDGINIPEAINDTLTLNNVLAANSGIYRCIATTGYGADTSNAANLSVIEVLPSEIYGLSQVSPFYATTYSVVAQQGHTYEFRVEGGNKIDSTANSIGIHWGENGTGYVRLIETDEHGCQGEPVVLRVDIYFAGNSEVVSRWSLVVSRPNPFSSFTTLEYELEKAATVNLSIYNHLGQQVSVLVDGEQTAGRQQARWDAEEMPAGVYFYQLRAEGIGQVGAGKIVKY